MMRIGFIGLGKMGLPMSHHLLQAGFSLTVHNRSRGAVDELVSAGAKAADNPVQVADQADIVLTCLPDVPAVEQVYLDQSGLLSAARPGQLFADHSTVSPKLSRKLYEMAKNNGYGFLDAPVSGGPAGAAAASLTVMVGGDEDAFQKTLPVFEAMGKNIRHVGPSGSGTIIKLANQLLVGIHTAAASEALVLATKAGTDLQTTLDVLSTSFGASAMLNRNGPMIMEGRFEGGTPVDLILKDLRLIAEVAEENSVRLLAGSLAQQIFAEASEQGLGAQDMSALVQPLEKLAGVQVGKRG